MMNGEMDAKGGRRRSVGKGVCMCSACGTVTATREVLYGGIVVGGNE